jgi:hypothetical protein
MLLFSNFNLKFQFMCYVITIVEYKTMLLQTNFIVDYQHII